MTAIGLVGSNRLNNSGLINVLAVFAFVLVAVSSIYSEHLLAMVAVWKHSETYAHCYFVLPGMLYLLWSSRANIDVAPQPSIMLTLLLFPLAFFWLFGALADVALINHFAIVSMIVISTMALLGWTLSKKILFPLGFLMLSVPVGEELIPIMIEFTADFTVNTLRMFGLPVFREGNYFALPTGSWSVVEACSGVRYMIASFTVGLLYAYLTYRSTKRRLLFMLVAIIVPIIANGLRAVMIVLLGHFSNMKIATGADHLIYGWVFFGVVIFIMFWIGNYWREDLDHDVSNANMVAGGVADATDPPDSLFDPSHVQGNISRFTIPVMLVLAGLISGPLWYSWATDSPTPRQQQQLAQVYAVDSSDLILPDGFQLCEQCQTGYQPFYKQADAIEHYYFQSATSGQVLSVYRAVYFSWSEQGELINARNLVVDYEDVNASRIVEHSSIELPGLSALNREVISGRSKYLSYNWRTVGGVFFKFGFAGKITEAQLKLTGKPFMSQFVAVYAPYQVVSEDVEPLLTEFIISNRNALGLSGEAQ